MTIFVGNLPYIVAEAQLRETFEEYGEVVSVRLIRDRESGQSRGFAFIVMPQDREALHAIQQLDRAVWGERVIDVNIAKPREAQGPADPETEIISSR